jgi:hypothetical protein
MPKPNLAPALAFAAAAIVLLSCGEAAPPTGTTGQQSVSAWYEEKIEEGFGHLDRLPRNWPGVPSPQHTAWSAGGRGE